MARKISLTRTSGEWDLIEKKIGGSGNKKINSFLRKEIFKLKKRHEQSPHNICAGGEREKRQFILTDEAFSLLEALSQKHNKPMCSIVDELIFMPLLLNQEASAVRG